MRIRRQGLARRERAGRQQHDERPTDPPCQRRAWHDSLLVQDGPHPWMRLIRKTFSTTWTFRRRARGSPTGRLSLTTQFNNIDNTSAMHDGILHLGTLAAGYTNAYDDIDHSAGPRTTPWLRYPSSLGRETAVVDYGRVADRSVLRRGQVAQASDSPSWLVMSGPPQEPRRHRPSSMTPTAMIAMTIAMPPRVNRNSTISHQSYRA